MSIIKLITHAPQPEKIITIAAKMCYSSKTINEISQLMNKDIKKKFKAS